MRISDWSSDVCSSDLIHAKDDQPRFLGPRAAEQVDPQPVAEIDLGVEAARQLDLARLLVDQRERAGDAVQPLRHDLPEPAISDDDRRAELRLARTVESAGERRVGEEWGHACRYRRARNNYKK